MWNIVPAFAVRSIQYFRLEMWYIVMHAGNVIYCYACSNWSHFIWQVLYFRVVVGLSAACKMSLELTISTVLILLLGQNSCVTVLVSFCLVAGLDCKVHIWYCKEIARLTAISLTAIGSYYWVTHFRKIAMQCPFFQIFESLMYKILTPVC